MKTKVMLLVVLCALAVSVSAQNSHAVSVAPNVRTVKPNATVGANLDGAGFNQPNAITKTLSAGSVTTLCANALCKSAIGGSVSANAKSMSNRLQPTQIEPPIAPPNAITHWSARAK